MADNVPTIEQVVRDRIRAILSLEDLYRLGGNCEPSDGGHYSAINDLIDVGAIEEDRVREICEAEQAGWEPEPDPFFFSGY